MSGLLALLDDVAAIAKVAAASVDDIAAAAAKAGAKAAGVVIDDAAVTPKYVHGFEADRELPIIWRIALGSVKNKLVILLPGLLALNYFLPAAITRAADAGGGIPVLRGRREGVPQAVSRMATMRSKRISTPRTPRIWKRKRWRVRSRPISSCRPRS